MEEKKTAHIPVLLQEVIDVLALDEHDVVFDGTAGGGGHAEAILEHLGPSGRYVCVDLDATALARVRTRIGSDPRVTLLQGNFRDIDQLCAQANAPTLDKILLDLGLSSDQLTPNEGGRGFTFQKDEPLLMTLTDMPHAEELTAMHVVNEWSEEVLADVVYGYGDERQSRRIARAIVDARQDGPITSSKQLADIIQAAIRRRGAVHPATRTFQAIRIAVNDELGALHEVLEKSITLLAPGGRIAVVSFHSLEDGIVKRAFKEWHKTERGVMVRKKPIVPGSDEIAQNKRARSSKLRVFEKAHQ